MVLARSHSVMSLVLAWAVVACVTIGSTANPASANALSGVTAADRVAIQGVIQAQLNAFQADDGVTAFGFASPSIRQIFGSPMTFMDMVRTGYQPVYRPREVTFTELIDFRGQPTQLVVLIGPDNEVVTAYYVMERQPGGDWLIDGCILRESADGTT